ncbi:MAG TPA: tyrosine-type recombinase/integrase [Clostridia bacterium]|nr:tyrosine-type recombinase/integrase [Clostridia bacterium]
MEEITLSPSGESLLSADAFRRLAEVPPEVEWFADIQNPNTRDAYRRDVAQFMSFLGIKRPDQFREVGRAHVIAWRKKLEGRKLSPASIRRKLSAVSSLFAYLCERNSIANNPATGVSRPKEGANEGKTPALSDDQARALLKAPPLDTWQGKRDRAMLAVLLYHGLRASELCSLKVGDFAERRGVKTLVVHGKGSKLRYLPVHPKAVAAISEYLAASPHASEETAPLFIPCPKRSVRKKPMLRQRVRELVQRYSKGLEMPKGSARPHALRATAATNALEHGADIAKVQDWLGHSNPDTTRLYDKRKDRPEESPTFRVVY